MCASMNRTGKINAKKGPETDYNSFKDFSAGGPIVDKSFSTVPGLNLRCV